MTVAVALLLAGCSNLSPQDHANLWACYAQLHALSQSVQQQVPACSALVDSLKAEGQ